MNENIERILQERNITYRPLIELKIEELDKATKKDLHTLIRASSTYVKDTLTGKRETLELYNCYFDSMNIRLLKIIKNTTFINCTFKNVKIKNCAFASATFVSCYFIDTYILDTNLQKSVFINCDGIEQTEMYNCNLHNAIFDNEDVDLNQLEENGCEILNIEIYNTLESVTTNSKIKNTENMATLPCGKEEADMTRQVINNKEYCDMEIVMQDLQNKCFNKCVFKNVIFEYAMLLDATTDFIECIFENMTLSGAYQKVAFDKSNFYNIIFNGEFSRCNFARCNFDDRTSISTKAMFYTCNFDLSNAHEIFENHMEQFTDVLFNQPIVSGDKLVANEENEIMPLIEEIYQVMKNNDLEYKSLEKKVDQFKNIKELSNQYISQLSDKDYITFITNMTIKRSSAKNDIDMSDEDSEDDTSTII